VSGTSVRVTGPARVVGVTVALWGVVGQMHWWSDWDSQDGGDGSTDRVGGDGLNDRLACAEMG